MLFLNTPTLDVLLNKIAVYDTKVTEVKSVSPGSGFDTYDKPKKKIEPKSNIKEGPSEYDSVLEKTLKQEGIIP